MLPVIIYSCEMISYTVKDEQILSANVLKQRIENTIALKLDEISEEKPKDK
jgi:hypothetical protein